MCLNTNIHSLNAKLHRRSSNMDGAPFLSQYHDWKDYKTRIVRSALLIVPEIPRNGFSILSLLMSARKQVIFKALVTTLRSRYTDLFGKH